MNIDNRYWFFALGLVFAFALYSMPEQQNTWSEDLQSNYPDSQIRNGDDLASLRFMNMTDNLQPDGSNRYIAGDVVCAQSNVSVGRCNTQDEASGVVVESPSFIMVDKELRRQLDFNNSEGANLTVVALKGIVKARVNCTVTINVNTSLQISNISNVKLYEKRVGTNVTAAYSLFSCTHTAPIVDYVWLN